MKSDISRIYIKNSNPQTFEYGTMDCALWAFRYVKNVNGMDLYSKYVGKYKTWAGGRSALRKQRDGSLVEYLDKNFVRIDPSFASRGDLVMCRGAVGICQGTFSFFLNKKELAHLSTLGCRYAWKVKEKCRK